MRRPRLNALRTFETVGRQLSFSLAAQELHITQAAVSQQIRQLEDDLGEPLFYRHHRQISLTAAARRYLPTVQKALSLLDAATAREFGATQKQQVTIRCTSSIATQWLAPHVGDFHTQNPGIALHFLTLEAGTGSGQPADIEVYCTNASVNTLGVTPLFDTTITPVAAPGLLECTLNRPEDILSFDLLHVVGYVEDWHHWFATYLSCWEKVPDGLSVDSSLFAIEAALRGDGIHLGRSPFIDKHLQSSALFEVFEQPLNLQTTYFMREHETTDNDPNIRKVALWINSLAKGLRETRLCLK